MKAFRLLTVSYRTTSAPFLAVRWLQELARENKPEFPLVSKVIEEDFNMDDLLIGANRIEKAIVLKNEINNNLLSGDFQLRKWASNDRRLVEIPDSREPNSFITCHEGVDNKLLRVLWNHHADNLKYEFQLAVIKRVTKRTILAKASQIFDPLGLISPIMVIAKIILQ